MGRKYSYIPRGKDADGIMRYEYIDDIVDGAYAAFMVDYGRRMELNEHGAYYMAGALDVYKRIRDALSCEGTEGTNEAV